MNKLTSLKEEFNALKSGIEKIERAASDAGRDLTDAEQLDVDKLYERAAVIKPEIEAEAEKAENMQAVGSILDRLSVPNVTKSRASHIEATPMTAGEFLANAFKVQAGLMSQDEHVSRAAVYLDRANQVVADTLGIVPTPIVGELIDLYDANRPVFNSFSARPMPTSGKTFERPKVTQHVSTDVQATELTELASQKMTVESDTVTKSTIGGYLQLSQQDVDWTDPSALQLLVQDFLKVYSRNTEVLASEYLMSNVTATSGWDISTIAKAVETFVTAFQAVDNAAEESADTIWLDINSRAQLAQVVNDGEDKTALTMIKETLADYGIGGVKFVFGRFLVDDSATPVPFRAVGSSRLVESYEKTNGLLQAVTPSLLGQTVAYSGYHAFHITPAGFIKLV